MPDRTQPKVFNRAGQKERRQELRNHLTHAERLLWWELRQEKLLGFRFRRQHGVGPYIADFYCPAAKVAVELDGDSHFDPDAKKSDAARDAYFESAGVRVLRFTNWDVFENRPAVVRAIAVALKGCGADGRGGPSPVSPSAKPRRLGAGRRRLPNAGT